MASLAIRCGLLLKTEASADCFRCIRHCFATGSFARRPARFCITLTSKA